MPWGGDMIGRIGMLAGIIMVLAGCVSENEATDKEETRVMYDFDRAWNFNDPAKTESTFRTLLSETDEPAGSEYVLALNTQIARTLGLQQKFEAAHDQLDLVEKQIEPDQTVVKIRYLLERGRVLNSSGKKADAVPFFLEAWELGLDVKADYYAVDAAHMLGIAATPEQQLIWNEKAVKLAEKSKDTRTQDWLGSLYNNIGWTYHDSQDYDKAMEVFMKALAWREGKGQVSETQIAKWCVARTHRSLGNIDQALDMQLALAKEMESAGQPADGYVLEEIAECLTTQGKPTEAASYFKRAWDILSQDIWLQKNEGDRLARLKSLGELSS